MKRPGVVWVYSIVVFIGILITVISSIALLSNPYGKLGLSAFAYEGAIISLFLIIPEIVFIYLFFTMKKSCLLWLYISFGLTILLSLIATKWFYAIIAALIGWAAWDYVMHKKIDGQQVFN